MERKVFFPEGQVEKAYELAGTLGVGLFEKTLVDNDGCAVAGFWADFYECPELKKQIERLQETHGALVYYVTHERMMFGECYSMLYVSKYEEDWPHQTVRKYPSGDMIVMAYVWNVTAEHNSEFGSITVKNNRGILSRVG